MKNHVGEGCITLLILDFIFHETIPNFQEVNILLSYRPTPLQKLAGEYEEKKYKYFFSIFILFSGVVNVSGDRTSLSS